MKGAVALGNAAFGQGSGSIVHVYCYGYEGRLIDCDYHEVIGGYCIHAEDASVKCCK